MAKARQASVKEGKGSLDVYDKNRERIMAAWKKFIKTGELDERILRKEIASSWKRCSEMNLDPSIEKINRLVSADEREEHLKRSRILLEVARPFIANLYESIREMEVAVILTDKDGFIVEILAEGTIKTMMNSAGLVFGQYLTEETIGTTAPSIVLKIKKPMRVVADEHWCEIAKVCTCAAAPIHDPGGELVGVLDITARYDIAEEHPHTYGMVVAAANAIETQLQLRTTSDELYKSHEYLNATIQSISDGLIVVDKQMRVIQLNLLASELTGLQVGRRLTTAMKNEKMVDKIRAIMGSKVGLSGLEAIFSNANGEDQMVILDAEAILDDKGDFLGVVLILREMKRMRKLAHRIYGARALFTFEDIVGEDHEFVKCTETLKMAARTDCPIVITGESGTGKEMFAQAVHNYSDRRDGPFIPLNCAAIPKDLLESELFGYDEGAFTGAKRGGNPGKFELADGGTIFLDEVDSMPLDMQAKLLRLIEEKRVLRLGGKSFVPVDVRIISASNKDLMDRTREGAFRDDLYFRLNVVGVNIPPLRDRRKDVALLAKHFIEKYTKSPGEAERFLKPGILETLQAYEWPGNVRELSNWVERLLALGKNEGPSQEMMIPAGSSQERRGDRGSSSAKAVKLEDREAQHIKEAIAGNNGVISRAASELGISRATLYRKIAKYGIEVDRDGID
jgi:transcriptional regulator of acetoin/glycerol metabolism